ncbi:MAG TPA: DUF308 domain-containing protein [Polyangiaceae bacterium]|nr:DUF308 domain-containing protein [Polyangiaceae bacterium]
MFLERAAHRWWTLVIRGLLAILFGILTVTLPGATILTLVFVYGIFAIADGLTSLSLFLRPASEGGWLVALGGLVSIAAGIIALVWPGITALALIWLIAIAAIVVGVLEISAAVAYSKELENEWAFVLSGVLWIAFGVIELVWPGVGIVAALALIATFAIIRGVTLIVSGVRLHRAFSHRPVGAALR